MSTLGAGSLELSLTPLESDDAQHLNIGGFDIDMTLEAGFTLNLELVSVTEGSVGFTGWIAGVPGMPVDENEEPAKLRVAGNIYSNGAFRVSGAADNLSFSSFALDVDASVAVANYDPETTADPGSLDEQNAWNPLNVRVYFDGSLTNTLLGADFSAKGDLATDGTGELTLALRNNNSGSFSYNGLTFEIPDGSSTVKLQQVLVDGNLIGSVWFDGEISDVASGLVSSLNVSGHIYSSGLFSITGSIDNLESNVEFLQFTVARITGSFSVTITQNGFTGSISGAKLQTPGLTEEWVTNYTGTATIDKNGNGIFTYTKDGQIFEIAFSPPFP